MTSASSGSLAENAARADLGIAYDEDAVRGVLRRVVEVGGELTFPVAPLPVLVPRPVVDEMLAAVRIYLAHLGRPGFLAQAREAVPPAHRAAGEPEPLPTFSQFDFALSQGPDGGLGLHLIECQGVSSLMGFVPFYGELLAKALAPDHTPLLTHASLADYAEDLRRVLAGAWLIDVDVSHQRLRADFWILRHLAGIEIADLTPEVVRQVDLEDPPLYNRIVPPDARRSGWLHVMQDLYARPRRWVTHPDWYYALSKRTLLDLQGVWPLVPESALLTPESALRWSARAGVVLKPLDDYGGTGVLLEPGAEDLRAALAAPEAHLLQRRIAIDRVLTAPDGQRLFCELRVLCLEDRPCALFCRLARDPLVSIARNAGFAWCGITAGLVRRD